MAASRYWSRAAEVKESEPTKKDRAVRRRADELHEAGNGAADRLPPVATAITNAVT
jgi:hypothetical protein